MHERGPTAGRMGTARGRVGVSRGCNEGSCSTRLNTFECIAPVTGWAACNQPAASAAAPPRTLQVCTAIPLPTQPAASRRERGRTSERHERLVSVGRHGGGVGRQPALGQPLIGARPEVGVPTWARGGATQRSSARVGGLGSGQERHKNLTVAVGRTRPRPARGGPKGPQTTRPDGRRPERSRVGKGR